jgi:hypothetical protein
MTINYIIMILSIKICNISPNSCHFLVVFIYVEDVYKHWSHLHMI